MVIGDVIRWQNYSWILFPFFFYPLFASYHRAGGSRGGSEGKKREGGGEIANHPRENLKKAAIRGKKRNASQKKGGVLMTILSVFGAVLGTALPGRANVVRLRRAPAAAVVWSTQTHIKTERLLDRYYTHPYTSCCWYLTSSPEGLLDARLVRRGVQCPLCRTLRRR